MSRGSLVESAPHPRPPFERWPVQVYDPRFGYVWWAARATIVTQSTIDRGTMRSSAFLLQLIDGALAARPDEVSEHGGVLVFHDWTTIRSYDADARRAYAEHVANRPSSYLRHSVVVVPRLPALRVAIELSNVVLAARSGVTKVEVAVDARTAWAKYQVPAPAPGTRFPGLA